MVPSPRSDPRVERSRAAVIAATLELLTEHGYAGTSIDAISKRSGVARTTIYRHWHSLAEIAHEAAISSSPEHVVPDTGDLRGDIRGLAGHLADKLNESGWGELLPTLIDAARRDPEILALQQRVSHDRRTASMAVIERAQANSELKDGINLDIVGEMMVGAIFTRHLVSHRPLNDEFLDQLTDEVYRHIAR